MLAIFINAVVIGLETDADLMASYGRALHTFNLVFQIFFTVEVSLRILAYGRRPLQFFRDGWNVFDFLIVAASFIPAVGAFSTVARLARLLRVARIVSVSPQLRLIVATMFRSIPSLGHVVLLTSVLMYIYAVAGYEWFHKTDPENWGSLGQSFLTLFVVVTLEGWADLQKTQMDAGHPHAWLFFVTYIVLIVFVVINLFIAVVINNLQDVKEEQEHAAAESDPHRDLLVTIENLKSQLERLEKQVRERR